MSSSARLSTSSAKVVGAAWSTTRPRRAASTCIPRTRLDATHSRFAGDDVVRVPGQHLLEQDAGLHARERGAEAQVLAEAEREVRRVRVASDVEHVRRRAERALVAIARRVEHHEVVELLDLDPADDACRRSRFGRTPGSA